MKSYNSYVIYDVDSVGESQITFIYNFSISFLLRNANKPHAYRWVGYINMNIEIQNVYPKFVTWQRMVTKS